MALQSRPTLRQKRYPLMNTLSVAQMQRIQKIIRLYRSDLDDPAAVEVLTIVLEMCRILDLLPSEVERLFTRRLLNTLEHWDGLIVYAPGQSLRPAQLHRAWVWLPNRRAPHLVAVGADGTTALYADTGKRKEKKHLQEVPHLQEAPHLLVADGTTCLYTDISKRKEKKQ